MQFRQQTRKPDREERILPLINVVFLLLIFFMLAGQLADPEPFRVAPPESDAAGPAEPSGPEQSEARVLLSADGRLALDGQPVEAAHLEAAIAERIARQPDLRVSLKADGAADADEAVGIMEVLRDAGVRHLQLFAQPLAQRQPAADEARP